MKEYTAIKEDGKAIISIYACDLLDAERIIAIHLRGRPGIDYYEMWAKDGKQIREGV
ncbi:hypothetical protein LCGC14_1128550 [marine sediment metagenome]|uniref:Uncharacterized protein n=1 Tax=marine sediment metagenome TaxID=412755 RepID=A0A0F9Q7M9_9ZZZZ